MGTPQGSRMICVKIFRRWNIATGQIAHVEVETAVVKKRTRTLKAQAKTSVHVWDSATMECLQVLQGGHVGALVLVNPLFVDADGGHRRALVLQQAVDGLGGLLPGLGVGQCKKRKKQHGSPGLDGHHSLIHLGVGFKYK